MRTRIVMIAALLASFFTMGRAQESDMYYVHFADGRVWGYPKEYVKSVSGDGEVYTLVLENDSVVSWPDGQVTAVDETAPAYPQFKAFKLDDKLNDQLYRDVTATVTADAVTATVSGIGKWLTPMFTMDMADAVAYVDGVEQVSGAARHRFADEVVYTLSRPDYRRLSVMKVSDEIWSTPAGDVAEIALTADMLSTNAPTSMTNEGLGMMLDNEPGTLFHSTWSQDPIYDVDLSKQVYVSVALEKPISALKFYYRGRMDASTYNIYEWKIEASNDGEQWTEVTTLDETAGVPVTGSGVSFTSEAIALGGEYSHVRFVAVRVGYKNYLCLSEFRLYEVTGGDSEPELLQPAQYDYRMVPMGREVPVRIDWLTDRATSVPRIDINIDGGEMVTSKDYYLNAHISFTGNGVWDDYDFQDSVKIKGRGNTSWSTPSTYYNPKNPYRLKFADSQKPFGMKKGKNWNLIPQAQTGSLMSNPVAHKIARLVGMETANDAIPVELYMNGKYRGSYYFTQKVGMANNSVDFEDESMAALFELDSYSEVGQFSSSSYGLPVNIKAPEFAYDYEYGDWLPTDETYLDYYGVQEEFNRFESAVYDNSNYERFVDMDMLVRYMLVNDLVLNSELGHPKSTFLSREDMGNMTRRYVFGPAWDFDWAYGYERGHSYCVNGAEVDLFEYVQNVGARFYSDILRSSDWVQYRYSKLWAEFVDKHLDEVIDFVDDYYAYARSSFVHNSDMWGDGSNYDTNVANMKTWLVARAQYIIGSLATYDADAPEPFAYGDLNGDGTISTADVEYMLAALFDDAHDDLQLSQADADADGAVSLSDLTWLSLLLADEQGAQARARREATLWKDDSEEEESGWDMDIDDFTTLVPTADAPSRAATRTATDAIAVVASAQEGTWHVDVSLNNAVPYIAYMMDFVLPEGFTVADGNASITLAARTANTHQMTGRMLDGNVYRVVGYSADNAAITGAEGELFTLSLNLSQTVEQGTYPLSVNNVTFVTTNAIEYPLSGAATSIEVTDRKSVQAIQFGAIPVKTYGDAPFALPQYTDADLEIAYSSSNIAVAVVKGHEVSVVGAGSADVTASQEGNDSYYAASPVVNTLTVAKAPLTIVADDVERYEGESVRYTLTYQGFVNGDTEDDLADLPQILCVADESSPAGTYPIRLVGGSDRNYEYTLQDGTLTVNVPAGVDTVLGILSGPMDVYDIRGRLVKRNATSLDGLTKGVYIVNRQKVVLR